MSKRFQKHQALRRAETRVRPDEPDHSDQIARINVISQTARSSWFGLLSYLAFVGVTLMGVEDADFFIPERQTQLPIIGVSIPTFLFFAIAPLLGSALFAYHQLHLLKLWELLAAAPARIKGKPLSDHITPWLIIDFALGNRRDRALRPRPMRLVTHTVSFGLVFLATPVVLFIFWLWSMPAHDEMLTVVFCGVPLLVSIYIAAQSWWLLRRLTDRKRRTRRSRTGPWLIVGLAVSFYGWVATEGTFDAYMRALYYTEEQIAASWLGGDIFPGLLARADLAGVDFVDIPPDWRDPEYAEAAFRKDWCKSEGIPTLACPLPKSALDADRNFVLTQRDLWCADRLRIAESDDCAALFVRFEEQQTLAWELQRTSDIGALSSRNLRYVDLRNADLRWARMEGADLRGARMEEANLNGARMEGADLFGAGMDEASLFGTRMEGANLGWIWMDGVYLREARMKGANLIGAQMEGADLIEVSLEGVDLRSARMEGARLRSVTFDGKTFLDATHLDYASVERMDLSPVAVSQDQVNSLFGDGSVTLPEGLERPPHWPEGRLDLYEFETQWRAWQVSEGYITPPKRE